MTIKVSLAVCMLATTFLSAFADEEQREGQSTDERKAYWQEYAETVLPIDFDERVTNVFFSMFAYSGDCDMHLSYHPRSAYMQIRFVRADREVLGLTIEPFSVFRESEDVLYVGNYRYTKWGRSVAAYDLATGKILWHMTLENQYNDLRSKPGRITLKPIEDAIFVAGEERNGDYVEILDQKTGQRLAYHIEPRNVKSKPIENEEGE